MQALTAATSSDQECGGDSAAPVSVPATNIRNGSTNAIDTKRGVRFLDTARSGLNAADSAKKLSVVDVQRDEKPSKKRDYEAHTINGTIAPAPTVSRRKKKPKGMPKRPLSAYNFFFQKERVNVLAEAAGENASDVDALMAFMPEFPEEDSGHNSSSHNNNIQSSNAPVSFENLGKTIGRRWQSLSQIERKRYELLAQEDAVRYKGEMDAFHEAKRARNERQAVYEPKELPSSNAGSSVHDFGGHISVLSGPPEIRFLPYNFPLQARFPGQMHPGESLSQYKHPPEWPPQPPASAPAVAVSGSASSEVEAPSEYQFPVPPGTESKSCRVRDV